MVEAEESDDDANIVPEEKPCNSLGQHKGAPFTVLLVEDDCVTCRLVAEGLKSCRYNVMPAENGRVALDILASKRGRKIDIILTDVKMPEVSGIELASEVMGKKGHPPIVVMSTDFHPDTVIRALAAGASDFLCKPLKRESLLSLWTHARAIQGKRSTGPVDGSIAAKTEERATALESMPLPPQESMQASNRSAFQSRQNGKSAYVIDSTTSIRQRLPFQMNADGTYHASPGIPCAIPGETQTAVEGRQDKGQTDTRATAHQASLALQRHLWLALGLDAQQAAGPMRNASWPPNAKSAALDSMGASNSIQYPVLSHQAHFSELNHPNGSGLKLDIEPLLRVEKHSCPAQSERPQQIQERQPAPATSNGLQALRHCKYVSAFTPVSPKFQAAMHNKDHRPRAFQRQGGAQLQPVGVQQHQTLASLPMIAGVNLPALIAPQPVFYQALRAFQEASAPQQKPVSTATANRKAAIERFRAKRTQRSFEKKVRYTSRQRLAENRPRLKGQFTKAASQSGELAEATPSTELNTGNSDEAQL